MMCNRPYFLDLLRNAVARKVGVWTVLGAFMCDICVADALKDTPKAPAVFVRNYLDRGTEFKINQPDKPAGKISQIVARGEYESAAFSVRAGNLPLKGVSVQFASDLKTETGESISRDAVQIRMVEPLSGWHQRGYRIPLDKGESDTYKNCAWSLRKIEADLDMAPDSMRSFWLTLHVPVTAKPGTYCCELVVSHKLSAAGSPSVPLKLLKYEVTVPAFHLLSAKDTGMAFFMFNDTSLYPNELVNEQFQKQVFDDMREHGMTTATLYLYPRQKNGRIDLTVADAEHLGFAQTMNLLRNSDLPAQGVPVIWIGAENYSADVWTQVQAERVRANWPELLFYAVDEPGDNDRNIRVKEFMEKLSKFRAGNPQYNLRVTTAIRSSQGINTVGGYYDVWIGSMAQKSGEANPLDDAARKGKELWIYDCNLAPVDPETDRYYFGIWAWVSGVKGCCHWAYFDGWPRFSYVYPTADEIISTIGWESVREGIDDYRYLFTLKKLTEKARAAGKTDLTAASDRLFAEVSKMVTAENYGRSYDAALKNGGEAAAAYRRPRVEPQLELTAYDQLKRKISDQISKLSMALMEPTIQ